jgi:thiol-disulfide isomerase/thioredoxin
MNRDKALFSYMVDEIVDVMDYFNVTATDLPIVVGHNAVNDFKYKSEPRIALQMKQLQSFVTGVSSGKVSRIFKSEAVPSKKAQDASRGVVIATGSTVESIVSQTDKDVFLEVYVPWCAQCKKIRATLEILARAVQADPRIVVAKIDASANDLPVSWNIKGYPALLYFKAADKLGDNQLAPLHYSEVGYGLHDIFMYIVGESSFEPSTLRVATPEQIGTLLSDEDALRASYEAQDRFLQRNEGRERFDNAVLDYLDGEVVFDGKRWHIFAFASLVLLVVYQAISVLFSPSSNGATKKLEKATTGSKLSHSE